MEPSKVSNHLTGMFLAYTFIMIMVGVEIYQTQAIVKLSKALDANTAQNIILIEQSRKIFDQGYNRDLEIAKLKSILTVEEDNNKNVPMEAK